MKTISSQESLQEAIWQNQIIILRFGSESFISCKALQKQNQDMELGTSIGLPYLSYSQRATGTKCATGCVYGARYYRVCGGKADDSAKRLFQSKSDTGED